MDAAKGLKPYTDLVEPRLEALLPRPDQSPAPLCNAMRYAALAPGKRLRPAMAMASAVAVGGEATMALDAGCAIEMVHCFSLIHDDLPALDNDDLRRGLPTCHRKFGEAMAILAGDALFALAFEVLATAPGDHVTPDRIAAAVTELATACGAARGLVGGEALDLLSEGAEPDLDLLRHIHAGKTGALFSGTCAIGAIYGGGNLQQIKALGDYGLEVGLAFQIADDILNETSTAETLGKAVGSDRERQKMTYPSLMGLDAARLEAQNTLTRALACLEGLPGETEPLRDLARFAVARAS